MGRSYVRIAVDDRVATVEGETLVAGWRPDFVASSQQVTWDDGRPMSDEEKAAVLAALREVGRRGKWRLEIV